MTERFPPAEALGRPLALPCGAVLKNRLAKAAMSDSLGDGAGGATETQARVYERWAQGGFALSLVGEAQCDPRHPEKPGNIVLGERADARMLERLARRATIDGALIWPQLGHAGALSHPPVGRPRGPSPLDIDGLRCAGLSAEEIERLPAIYARSAGLAKSAGFGGVQIHAAHGFLLSQFLSPLFNRRTDGYGGSIEARCRTLISIVAHVREAVGPDFPIGVKINCTDNLEGGLLQEHALDTIGLLDRTTVDLIDISAGTYFPGAKSSSDRVGAGPYFVAFARRARGRTSKPLMLTGGFKTRTQAADAVASGAADLVGLARAAVLDPQLANGWLGAEGGDPKFPRFDKPPPGGVTAWYTMRITALGEDREDAFALGLDEAIETYEQRDSERCELWRAKFGDPPSADGTPLS